jgi:hypothetical protein
MFRIRSWVIAISITALIASCKDRKPPAEEASNAGTPTPETSTAALPAPNDVTDKWLGKWIGPEGTYLMLSKSAGKYVVLINSLDGPATYEGTAAGDRIEFQRDGKTETIHAGNGHDTGMKWLMDKTNCLVINAGEGFCRD